MQFLWEAYELYTSRLYKFASLGSFDVLLLSSASIQKLQKCYSEV